MGFRPRLLAVAAAGVVTLTPAAAAAALRDAFSPGPRLDLALEFDYRGRYLTPEHVLRDEPPPDRIGREQLAEAKEQVAREYVRELTDSLLDEMLETFPIFATLGRRYEALTTFRFFTGDARRGARDGGATPGLFRAFPGGGAVGELPARIPITLRFRLNAGLDRVSPSVEVMRGILRCRVSFDAARDRLEVLLARRLWKSLDLELVHAEALGGGGSESRLAITLAF